jgi:hypothetical protein
MSDQSTIFAELVVNLGALAGVTTAGVGVAHVVTTIEPWCNNTTGVDHGCVGPLLVWNTDDSFSHVSHALPNQNHHVKHPSKSQFAT